MQGTNMKTIKTLLLAATPFVPVQNYMAYRRLNWWSRVRYI